MSNSNLYNINIERALLSAILFDAYQPHVQVLFSQLKSTDFYLPFHQHFFSACDELMQAGKPIDEEFTRNLLLKNGTFNEIDMIDLMSATSISNVEAYMRDVIALSQKRSLVTVATEIRKNIIEDGAEALETIDISIKRIEQIAENGSITIKRTSIVDMIAEETEFWCKSWLPIPKGTLSMITAPGGTGKTWLVLQLAVRMAKEEVGKKIFLWLSEDPSGSVKSRYESIQREILSSYGAHAIAKNIDVSVADPLLLLDVQGHAAKINSKFYAMKRELREYDVIVIDPLLAFYGGDENNNSQARVFMQAFLNWCRGEGKTIIFLHHSRKGESNGGSRSRGAGAIIDAVRCVYDMEHITVRKDDKQVPDTSKLGMRRFTLTKDNYGAARYTDSFVFDREITPRRGAQVVEVEYEEAISLDMPSI